MSVAVVSSPIEGFLEAVEVCDIVDVFNINKECDNGRNMINTLLYLNLSRTSTRIDICCHVIRTIDTMATE